MWLLRYIWAGPYTLLGLVIGLPCLLGGARVQVHTGVVEFHGGLAARLLDCLPLPGVLAITIGHTVIGRCPAALDETRTHERVHVEQYGRWGPLMGPAYLLCAAVVWLRGGDAYRDNPFEVAAFRVDP